MSLPAFKQAVGTAQTTVCELHVTFDDGVPGKRLVVEGIDVWGGVKLGVLNSMRETVDGARGGERGDDGGGVDFGSAEVLAEFYTGGFWSEDAINQVRNCHALIKT